MMNQPTNYFETIFTAESIRAGLTDVIIPSATQFQSNIVKACLSVIKKLKANEFGINIRIPMKDLLLEGNHIGFETAKWFPTSYPNFALEVFGRTEQLLYKALMYYSIYRDYDVPIIVKTPDEKRTDRWELFQQKIEEETGIIFNADYSSADGKKLKLGKAMSVKVGEEAGLDLLIHSTKLRECGCGCGKMGFLNMKKTASLCGIRYCSEEHQLNDWAKHKEACEKCRLYKK
jgi:hypothetical protein